VAKVLGEKFGIAGIGTVEDDIKLVYVLKLKIKHGITDKGPIGNDWPFVQYSAIF